ncbi:MAG: GIY-YIG nuclease family protein [Bacteroidetes bacterium]|nr:GIY-YIG nuclease family protein [Bacteroidota bacterium]
MITVYVLESMHSRWLYVGMTNNLQRRFHQHQSGYVRSTKARRPYRIIYIATFPSRTETRVHEKYLKSTARKRYLRSILPSQQPSNPPA